MVYRGCSFPGRWDRLGGKYEQGYEPDQLFSRRYGGRWFAFRAFFLWSPLRWWLVWRRGNTLTDWFVFLIHTSYCFVFPGNFGISFWARWAVHNGDDFITDFPRGSIPYFLELAVDIYFTMDKQRDRKQKNKKTAKECQVCMRPKTEDQRKTRRTFLISRTPSVHGILFPLHCVYA